MKGKSYMPSKVTMSSTAAYVTGGDMSYPMMSPPAQAPGILDGLLPGKDAAGAGTQAQPESIWDKMQDPLGKKKEAQEKKRQEKIKELYGGSKTAISTLDQQSEIENVLNNKPNLGFKPSNMIIDAKAMDLSKVNKGLENLKASTFRVEGMGAVAGLSSYQDL